MHRQINDISSAIIGAAIEVHRILGPGLLESAYELSLAHELSLRHIPFERQKPLPLDYKGIRLDCGYRLDFLVADLVVVEIKAIDVLLPSTTLNYSAISSLADGSWGCSSTFTRHYSVKASSALSSDLTSPNPPARRPNPHFS